MLGLLIGDRNTVEKNVNNERRSSIVHAPHPVVDRITLFGGLGLVAVIIVSKRS